MSIKRFPLLLASLAAFALFALPALASDASKDHASCDKHAKHIDHVIGAKKALEAYHVLHGDKGDDTHIIAELKHDHPDIEHELEEFVKSGCTDKDLEAHAHDDDH